VYEDYVRGIRHSNSPIPAPNNRAVAGGAARGKTFRIGLDVELCAELERAAAARGLDPEVLLNSIGRVVVCDGLINAVLDDLPMSS
jgi:hypothetical protein